MNKKTFYPFNDNEIRLPYTWEDYLGTENYEGLSIDTKLMHFYYAISHGLNIKDEINRYIAECNKISSINVKHSLVSLISYMRYGQDKHGQEDRDVTCIVLEDELSLDDIFDLFSVELQIRFNYCENDDGIIVFSQKYIRSISFKVLQKYKNEDEIKEIITHPTGYKKISDVFCT